MIIRVKIQYCIFTLTLFKLVVSENIEGKDIEWLVGKRTKNHRLC